MTIIGEKLNSSIPKTLDALKAHDEDYIVSLIKAQTDKGADYIDVNTALMGDDETATMLWVINLVKQYSNCGIMPDSPNPEVILKAIDTIGDRAVIINSITAEDKYNVLYDTIVRKSCGVICMPMGDSGFPMTSSERIKNADRMVSALKAAGVSPDNIYVDIVVQAVAADMEAAKAALDTLSKVKSILGVRTVGGMSNISFGLPMRKHINTAFLAMAMAYGLDAAIIDITSEPVRSTVYASNALLGADEYCLEYIGYTREE